MSKFLQKINPFNWLENFFIKRMVKKIIKLFPKLKEKGLLAIEKHGDELKQMVEIKIVEFIESIKK